MHIQWPNFNMSAPASLVFITGLLLPASGVAAPPTLPNMSSVVDAGADPTGKSDSSSAFNAASTFSIIPPGTYLTSDSTSNPAAAIIFNARFSGNTPYLGWTPFGSALFPLAVTHSRGGNAILGAVRNTRAPNSLAYPTGVTGYGRTDNPGNTAFGIYAAADLRNTGVATNEIDSLNYFGEPSGSLPPNRKIGTPQTLPIALTVASGGRFNSAIGIHVTREGSSPQAFLTGIYLSPDCCTNYGLYIAADKPNHLGAGSTTMGQQLVVSSARAVNMGASSDTLAAGIASTYESSNQPAGPFTVKIAAPNRDGERRRICFKHMTGDLPPIVVPGAS